MSSTELHANVLELGANVAGIKEFLLPELIARIKRLEEDRQSSYEMLHNLTRKVEAQAALLESIQKANQ